MTLFIFFCITISFGWGGTSPTRNGPLGEGKSIAPVLCKAVERSLLESACDAESHLPLTWALTWVSEWRPRYMNRETGTVRVE